MTLRDQGPERVSPLAIPLLMANAASGVLAMRYGLEEPSPSGPCRPAPPRPTSIGMAARLIAYGDADAVVTGGSESTLTPRTAAFRRMEATSPSGVSCPSTAAATPS